MKRLLLFALALLAASEVEARDRRCYSRGNRTRDCVSYAFFEAFPSSGAGTSGVCSTTAPTGARGESLSFTRASSATCTKTATGGLATTDIADGDLVVLSSNVARVEYDSAGTLGLRVEAAGTNLLLRSDALTNAAWADVGTPTVTDGATDPFGGVTGDTIEDNDGAAYEGRSQSITVSAGAAHLLHCYVKAGTRAEARVTLDGTAATITGLSATTWSILQVADASSSGTSIAVEVLVGDAVGDTGTVIWGGCDAKTGTYRTSYAPTAGATATRAAEVPYFAVGGTWASGSMAATVWHLGGGFDKGWMGLNTTLFRTFLYQNAADNVQLYVDGANRVATTTTTGSKRLAGYWGSAGVGVSGGGAFSTAAGVSETGSPTNFDLLTYNQSATLVQSGIISRVCLDSDPTRCR